MTILKELHAQGHTIILVTHDMAVASHADRIITLRDGRVVEDSSHRATDDNAASPSGTPAHPLPGDGSQLAALCRARCTGHRRRRPHRKPGLGSLPGGGRMALHAMLAHRMRTFLTMLGIIIGIAAVVSVVALGQGRAPR